MIALSKALLRIEQGINALDFASLRWVRDFVEDALGAADDRGFEKRARRALRVLDHLIATEVRAGHPPST